jgi:tetratricopeptide (TPR) repeat protein
MRLNRFVFLLLVGSLIGGFRVCGQEKFYKDSLLRQLSTAKEDSNKALLYISIGQQFESSEPEKAKQYYLQTKVLSEKIGWPKGFIKYAFNYTYVLNMQGLFDSGLIINQQAVVVARRLGEPILLAKALFNLGTSYRMSSAFEKALVSYEEGEKIFERVGDDRTEAQLDDILQSLYTQLQQYQKGVE